MPATPASENAEVGVNIDGGVEDMSCELANWCGSQAISSLFIPVTPLSDPREIRLLLISGRTHDARYDVENVCQWSVTTMRKGDVAITTAERSAFVESRAGVRELRT